MDSATLLVNCGNRPRPTSAVSLTGFVPPSKITRLKVYLRGEITILDMGSIEIWDGSDLVLQRETLKRLDKLERCECVGFEMHSVKYVPSGFFGMLCDWRLMQEYHSVRLYSPQPNIQNMLWFQEFFEPVGEGVYQLLDEPKHDLPFSDHPTTRRRKRRRRSRKLCASTKG